MIRLVPYSIEHEENIVSQINRFFGFHHALISGNMESTNDEQLEESRKTLEEWLVYPNELYVIADESNLAGFIRICYRGGNVAWIEDIFVDEDRRGRGIATAAIAAAESIIKNHPGYTAVCIDVSPRNSNALRLYHKLGYVDLSLITIRKEFESNNRNTQINMLDLDFNY